VRLAHRFGHGATSSPPMGAPRRAGPAPIAILDATLDLLAEHGYQALTIEAVAARAAVGRPTVYRRYATKADLVAAALVELTAGEPPVRPARRTTPSRSFSTPPRQPSAAAAG